MVSGQPVHGGNPTPRRVERAPQPGAPVTRSTSLSAWQGRASTIRPYKRPTLELPLDVICGTSEPSGGVAEIAAAVRLCLVSAGGPAEAAFANIAQARGTAAAIRLARAYVDVRPSDAAA
jgi:hypothetical protein